MCIPSDVRFIITHDFRKPLWLLAQNPAGQPPTADQNSTLNLYDAFGYQKRGTILDWGFSALIRYNGKTILFDTGNSADGFEHNVKALGVDLKQVDMAVLSHRHYDHISGFDYMLKGQARGESVPSRG